MEDVLKKNLKKCLRILFRDVSLQSLLENDPKASVKIDIFGPKHWLRRGFKTHKKSCQHSSVGRAADL
jgi:hypothetical protein